MSRQADRPQGRSGRRRRRRQRQGQGSRAVVSPETRDREKEGQAQQDEGRVAARGRDQGSPGRARHASKPRATSSRNAPTRSASEKGRARSRTALPHDVSGCRVGVHWCDVMRGDLRIGDEITDRHQQHEHEAEERGDAGVQRDRADDRPSPRVQQQSTQRLALEQRLDLTGEHSVLRVARARARSPLNTSCRRPSREVRAG